MRTYTVLLLLGCCMVPPLFGQTSFNDLGPLDGTHTNATTFGTGTSGPLKDIATGANLAARLAITNASTVVSTTQSSPDYGTPAFIVFDGFVDFGGNGVELGSAASVVTYVFTGLDPNAEYNFQGTGIRGEPTYTDRWALVEIGGASSFTSLHSPGTLTTAQVPGITASQVAINTGANIEGRLAWWEHIVPSAAGSFTVTCTKYSGTVPGGSSAGVKGYAITGIRLEKSGTYTGRTSVPPLPPRIANPELNHINGIKTVFLILMENHNWSTIKGAAECPYINNSLLPLASYATQYYTPPGLHPSEPNYLWLISGTNFGIRNDQPPSANHQSSTNTLFRLLDAGGISWKAYQENIPGNTVPDADAYPYAVRHDPFVFFDSVRNNLQYCTNHIRPYSELAGDLANDSAPRFCFITPNVTNDMHDSVSSSSRTQGDLWLKAEVPKILSSAAYTNSGLLLITWDEGGGNSDGPIGLIALSPRARGGGYTNSIRYTHSSTLRTLQNIFGVRPYLADAAFARDLSDLFKMPTIASYQHQNNSVTMVITNTLAGETNVLQVSADLSAPNWTSARTNIASGSSTTFTNSIPAGTSNRFYRVQGLPRF